MLETTLHFFSDGSLGFRGRSGYEPQFDGRWSEFEPIMTILNISQKRFETLWFFLLILD